MNSSLRIFSALALFYLAIILFGFQYALPVRYLLLPVPALLVFTTLALRGLNTALLVAFGVGFGLDLYLPFAFGTFLMTFLISTLVLFMLFRVLFTLQTGLSVLIIIAGGVLLSEILTWLFMHILHFFTGEGEVLALTQALLGAILLRTAVAVIFLLILNTLWKVVLAPLFSRFFSPTTKDATRL